MARSPLSAPGAARPLDRRCGWPPALAGRGLYSSRLQTRAEHPHPGDSVADRVDRLDRAAFLNPSTELELREAQIRARGRATRPRRQRCSGRSCGASPTTASPGPGSSQALGDDRPAGARRALSELRRLVPPVHAARTDRPPRGPRRRSARPRRRAPTSVTAGISQSQSSSECVDQAAGTAAGPAASSGARGRRAAPPRRRRPGAARGRAATRPSSAAVSTRRVRVHHRLVHGAPLQPLDAEAAGPSPASGWSREHVERHPPVLVAVAVHAHEPRRRGAGRGPAQLRPRLVRGGHRDPDHHDAAAASPSTLCRGAATSSAGALRARLAPREHAPRPRRRQQQDSATAPAGCGFALEARAPRGTPRRHGRQHGAPSTRPIATSWPRLGSSSASSPSPAISATSAPRENVRYTRRAERRGSPPRRCSAGAGRATRRPRGWPRARARSRPHGRPRSSR